MEWVIGMKTYRLEQLFEILKEKKITSNKESVRRWLREGKISGTKGAGPKKNGWQVTEEELQRFLSERLPASIQEKLEGNTTNVVISEAEKERLREEGRNDILNRLAAKHIWEGRFVFKKKWVNECLDHQRMTNKSTRSYILNRVLQHKQGYAAPGVLYMLDTFNFEGIKLKMDDSFSALDEQITFALIEYLRKEYIDPSRRKAETILK